MKSEKMSCRAALHALPGSTRREKCAQPRGYLIHAGLCKRSCSAFSASAAAAGGPPYEGWTSVRCCEEGAAVSHGGGGGGGEGEPSHAAHLSTRSKQLEFCLKRHDRAWCVQRHPAS